MPNVAPRLWILAVAVGSLGLVRLEPVARLERASFDGAVGSLHVDRLAPWPDDFVAVVVDDPAVTKLNPGKEWPLKREASLQIWARLRELGVKTILHDFTLTIRREAEVDGPLLEALPGVVLPISYGQPHEPDAIEVLHRLSLDVRPDGLFAIAPDRLQPPLREYAAAARGAGHVIGYADGDGLRRTFLPAIAFGDRVIPSMALVGLAIQRDLDMAAMKVTPTRLEVPGLPPIALRRGSVVMELARNAPPPPTVRVLDVLDPAKEAEMRAKVSGKMALVYPQVRTDQKVSPIGPETPGGVLIAHSIRTLAAGHAPSFPMPVATYATLLAAALALAGSVMRLAPRSIVGLGAAALFAYLAVHALAFRFADVFLPVAWPVAFLGGATLALYLHRTFSVVTRLEKAESRADAAKAPRGEIALVFTDVQGSTVLWERMPDAMRRALEMHNALIRELLAEARGYEVKTEGDAFMLAFASAPSAAAWCLTVQERLLALPWPDDLLAQPEAREEKDGERVLWRGLRVRMGVHLGEPEPREDPLTGRMDYFGPTVNRAARVAGAAHGGQILLSGDAWAKIEPLLASLPDARAKDLGRFFLKGLLAEERLVELVPAALAGRIFPAPKTAEGSIGERGNVRA